jgi:predicted metal-dependent phosphoesterase TrpH
MPGYCDLHSHTLCSDGVLSPEALVDLAATRRVAALAVTDHDTVEGLDAACARGVELGIEVVPGIELSIEEGSMDVHLLGYFVSRPAVLADALAEIRRERVTRARRIVERLRELGYELEYAAVAARARGGVVGRPHVAEEMVARGHVASLNDAFDRWLGADRPAYIAKRSVGLAAGAALLRAAGAVPVVAHPGPSDLDALVPWLRDQGVAGLEVWHPKHDESQRGRYAEMARRHGLVPTGGTDFHREIPGGLLPGDLQIPMSVLDALRPHAT